MRCIPPLSLASVENDYGPKQLDIEIQDGSSATELVTQRRRGGDCVISLLRPRHLPRFSVADLTRGLGVSMITYASRSGVSAQVLIPTATSHGFELVRGALRGLSCVGVARTGGSEKRD
jgi:hypothetical protein